MNPAPKKRNVTKWKGVAQKYEVQLRECAAIIGKTRTALDDEREAHDNARRARQMWQDSYAAQVKVATGCGIVALASIILNLVLIFR